MSLITDLEDFLHDHHPHGPSDGRRHGACGALAAHDDYDSADADHAL